MIIELPSAQVSHAIVAPTIGNTQVVQHLTDHPRLFSRLLADIDPLGRNKTMPGYSRSRSASLSICVERDRLRLSSTEDASRLSRGNGHKFAIDFVGELSRAALLAGMEDGALGYVASIHSIIISLNNLDDTKTQGASIGSALSAIEQDVNMIYTIVAHAANRERAQQR